MRKKYFPIRKPLPIILLLSVALIGAIVASIVLLQDIQTNRAGARRQAEQIQAQRFALQEKDTWKPVAIAAANDAVYFPDIRLRLPLTELTAQFAYGVRTSEAAGKAVTDVTTASFEAFIPTELYRLACTPLRLAFEDKANPYNPHEKPQPSVKLADGRTLQIYPFQEDSCDERFKLTGVDSFEIAKAFADAESTD